MLTVSCGYAKIIVYLTRPLLYAILYQWEYIKGEEALFKIGDKVVYPMHGAGVIEAIEEKEVLGEKRQYYILRLPVGDMKVMIPIANSGGGGLREVIDHDGVQRVFHILREQSSAMSPNWNRRYRANLEKIKSGNIYEVAEVVRNLITRDREKGLSSGERKMLENARQILISELVLATELEEDKAKSLLDSAFA
ncbi:MAG: RNA polymerase-binding transcription factor CarD [Pelotomaculum sp. PtaB.Bin104]|nr:MAG: RNA polymerase-binding transcription factor CarD [Pelotomaculum sp. PtaB.Bin104]